MLDRLLKKHTAEMKKTLDEVVKQNDEVRASMASFIGKALAYVPEETKGVAAGDPTVKPAKIKPGTVVSLPQGYAVADKDGGFITNGFATVNVQADGPIQAFQAVQASPLEFHYDMSFESVEVKGGGLFSAAMFSPTYTRVPKNIQVKVKGIAKLRTENGDEQEVKFDYKDDKISVNGTFKTRDPELAIKLGDSIPILDLVKASDKDVYYNVEISASSNNIDSFEQFLGSHMEGLSRQLTREMFGSTGRIRRSPTWDSTAFTKLSLATKKLDTILADTHDLKRKLQKKGQKWQTMEEVAPKWHKKITEYFTTHKGSNMVTSLEDHNRCIMAEASGWSNKWGNHADKPCLECSYLGTDALKLFSDFGQGDTYVRLTDSEGWNNYQARFEYHWNSAHSK